MENRIQLIIAQCEEEKLQLQQWIKEFLAESDYLAAHYHSQALYRLNHQLYTLRSIDDKLYEQKFFREHRIEGLKRMVENEKFAHARDFFEQEILNTLKEIEDLNKTPSQEISKDDETILEQALKDLIDKKIKNFKLILNKKNNLLLRFSYSNKKLNVSLPYVKHHVKKFLLTDEKIDVLKRLGFDLSDNQTVFSLIINDEKEKIIVRLRSILVKIVFEVFHYKDFKNESYIQFTEIGRHR